jgi:hypothetical protein
MRGRLRLTASAPIVIATMRGRPPASRLAPLLIERGGRHEVLEDLGCADQAVEVLECRRPASKVSLSCPGRTNSAAPVDLDE